MAKHQQGRQTSRYLILTCSCFMILVILILTFQAGPLTSLMQAHYLSPSPVFSSLPFLSTHYTANTTFPPATATPHSPLPSLLKIDAGPCTCSLHVTLLNPSEVLPQHMLNCTCPSSSIAPYNMSSIRDSSVRNASRFNYTSTQPSVDDTTGSPSLDCVPSTRAIEKVIEMKPCPPQKKVEEPWYVKGRSWHPPPRFPRCTMDTCFNYTRCENSDELLIYTYEKPGKPAKFFKGITESKYNTDDPNKACLFFVFLDTPGLYRSPLHPSELPYWHGGLNHVLITFGDKWLNKGPAPESIGFASTMTTVMHESVYRPGFDVSIPLPPKHLFAKVRRTKPFDRKYFMTFRGLRYLRNDGILRSFTEFRGMHNGEDVIVVTSCRHPSHKDLRRDNATLDEECRRDEALHDQYDFADLMNTTFGLAPAGRQPSSYRFAELLSAGAVPVLIADNYVKPFDNLVQWHRCIIQFPSTEIHRILKTVRAMKREEVERRQKYCLQVYARWFDGDDALFEASVEAQKTRFMGVFGSWPGISYID